MPQGNYERALREMRGSDPDVSKATEWLLAASANADHRATYALGTWHLHGTHFKRNLRKAIPLIRTAADNDVLDAIYDLAVCYEKGAGVRRSLKRAAELYLKAALGGEKQ